MDTQQLALKLAELGVKQSAYRVGRFGTGNSDAIVLESSSRGFEVYYTERGHNSLLASFNSESEACQYVLAQLAQDQCATSHNVGTFDSASQASALASKLSAAGVKVKTDEIPIGANSKRYRVFVFGNDLERVRKIRGW